MGMSRKAKEGLVSRKSDGYVFRITSVSSVGGGCAMQCVDAAKVLGFWTFDAIARDFEIDRVSL